MQYIGLICVVLLTAIQNIIQKQWNLEEEKSHTTKPFLFLAISALASVAFFAIQSGFQCEFRFDVFLCSVGFAVAYSAALIGTFLAIRWGSLSLTMLLTSYSLLIPVFYGLFFLKEKISYVGVAGIICLLISIFLIADKTQKATFSFKWIISIVAAFCGNGMCSTLQKRQQVLFEGHTNPNL